MWPMLPPGEGNPFLHATVGDVLATQAARVGDREAIVATDRRISYAELYRDAQRLARGLLACGVRKGDKVALWMPSRPEWFAVQYGCALIGAVVVALNTRYKAHELRYILGQSDATTLVCADHAGPVDYLETLAEVLPDLAGSVPGELEVAELPALRRVIVHADDPYPGCLAWRDVAEIGDAPEGADALAAARAAVTPDDPLTILYTSGTTSFPKGAIISHRNCVPHGWWCGAVMRVTEADRVLHALPLSGTWGGLCIPLATFTHGATLVLMETFEPAVALRLMDPAPDGRRADLGVERGGRDGGADARASRSGATRPLAPAHRRLRGHRRQRAGSLRGGGGASRGAPGLPALRHDRGERDGARTRPRRAA